MAVANDHPVAAAGITYPRSYEDINLVNQLKGNKSPVDDLQEAIPKKI